MRRSINRVFLILSVGIVGSCLFTVSVLAGSGFYAVDKTVRKGMLVSLTRNPGVIEPASNSNAESLVGIVGNSATDLTVQPGQIAVQTDGVVQALVSTISGDITVGDHISPSSITGIGAKATQNGWVIGAAQGSLSAETKDAVKTKITDEAGVVREVYVASIPVFIKIANQANTARASETDDQLLPEKLQKIADSIAGKRASALAVILSFVILLLASITTVYILNTSVRNGLQGIARQPLAKHEIIVRMLQSSGFAILFFIAAVVGAVAVIRTF